MTILNSGFCVLLSAAALLTGCGKQERIEAAQMAKVLTAKKTNFDQANSIEKDFVASAKAWCGGITSNGAGRGAELDQNASVATQLAQSTVAVSAQLSEVRQAIDTLSPKEEYPQSVRNGLITQLTKRQRGLQDMRALLQQAATQFLAYRQVKTYTGDTYPDGVVKLNAILQSYQEPEDAVGTALAALKTKYDLKDAEL